MEHWTTFEPSAHFWWSIVLVMVLVLAFYGLTGWYFRPRLKLSPIPRETPPEGISPAAARYIYQAGFDSNCLLAAVLNAAVKNCYRIAWSQASFSASMANYSLVHQLSRDEQAALSYHPACYLKRLIISRNKSKITDKAEDRMQQVLQQDYGAFLLNRKLMSLIVGGLSAFLLMACVFLFARPVLSQMLLYVFLLVPLMFILFRAVYTLLKDKNLNHVFEMIACLASVVTLMVMLDGPSTMPLSLAVLPFVGVNAGAYWLLPKYTRKGARLYRSIVEFRHYLAEKIEYDPQLKKEEAYLLPYLIALDVPFQNTAYFSELLIAYQPAGS